jgi:hypothetical protein
MYAAKSIPDVGNTGLNCKGSPQNLRLWMIAYLFYISKGYQLIRKRGWIGAFSPGRFVIYKHESPMVTSVAGFHQAILYAVGYKHQL